MLGGWHLCEEKPGGVYEAEQFVLVQNRPGTSSREPGLAQVEGGAGSGTGGLAAVLGVPIGVIHGGGKRASGDNWTGASGAVAEAQARPSLWSRPWAMF